jgi:hypothetical protein
MIRVDTETGRRLIVLQCDGCTVVFPFTIRTSFNLATVRQGQILRRAAKKKLWSHFDTDVVKALDFCPGCVPYPEEPNR